MSRPQELIPFGTPVNEHVAPLTPYKTQGYSPTQYEEEKALGIRKSTGALKLKKLRPWHHTIIRMHLAGIPAKEISRLTGRNYAYIHIVLNDPLSQEHIRRAANLHEMHFGALYGNVVDGIRDGLQEEQPVRVRLRAAEIYLKEKERQDGKVDDKETAEDVVAKIVNAIQVNVNVSTGDKRDG